MAEIKVGEVLCLKTSGEKVFILAVEEDKITVRRPFVGESGVYKHAIENFTLGELETISEHMYRQVDEMLQKGDAQKILMKAERKLNEDLEREAMEESKVVPFPTKVPRGDIN